MTNLSEMNLDELKAFAEEEGIDLGKKTAESSIRKAITEAISEELTPVESEVESPDGEPEVETGTDAPDLEAEPNVKATGFAYDESYFIDAYAEANGAPYGFNETWLKFFGNVALRIKNLFNPSSVLDAGCAFGVLVDRLNQHPGLNATGFDFSEYAIAQGKEVNGDAIYVHDLKNPIPTRGFDVVTCIEVLEHLPEADADVAIANLCNAVNDGGYIIFSSSATDHDSPSHENVQGEDYWLQKFKANGFQVDRTKNVGFVTHWALALHRVK